jgi:hypothetical protein
MRLGLVRRRGQVGHVAPLLAGWRFVDLHRVDQCLVQVGAETVAELATHQQGHQASKIRIASAYWYRFEPAAVCLRTAPAWCHAVSWLTTPDSALSVTGWLVSTSSRSSRTVVEAEVAGRGGCGGRCDEDDRGGGGEGDDPAWKATRVFLCGYGVSCSRKWSDNDG